MDWKPTLSKDQPKYLALVEALESDIRAGKLRAGDRLPTQRTLASQHNITIATVTKAIKEAANRGLVTARVGYGTIVSFTPAALASKWRFIDLSVNALPMRPVKSILDNAMATVGARSQSENFFGFEPASGIERHKATMARWLKPRNIELNPASIILTHGAQHALACCASLPAPNETILCEKWVYTGILRACRFANLQVVGVDLDDEGMMPGSLSDHLKRTGSKFVVCSASSQNPTRKTMSLSRRKEIIKICAKFEATIIEDDISARFVGDSIPPLAQLAPDQVIYITSVSKAIAPGFRLGAISAPERLRERLQENLLMSQWTAPSFFAELFYFMVEQNLAEACLSAHRAEAHDRISIAHKILGENGLDTPSYHLWLPIPKQQSASEVVAGLLHEGVRVTSSHYFAAQPEEPADEFIRICLGGVEDTSAITQGLTTIAGFFAGARRAAAPVI